MRRLGFGFALVRPKQYTHKHQQEDKGKVIANAFCDLKSHSGPAAEGEEATKGRLRSKVRRQTTSVSRFNSFFLVLLDANRHGRIRPTAARPPAIIDEATIWPYRSTNMTVPAASENRPQ